MMPDRMTIRLYEPQRAYQDILRAWQWIKASLIAGQRLVLEVRQETRSDAQNRLLHAWIGEIARTVEWAGKKRDIDTWKRLLAAAWLRARGEHVEVLPAVDGHGIDVVFRHTSKLTRSECAELCDYVIAWAVEHGVGVVDPETGEIREG